MVDPLRGPGKPAAVLFRAAGPPSGMLSGQRPQARGRRRPHRRGGLRTCRTRASCSAASTTATRSRRHFSTSGCGCSSAAPGSVLWLLGANELVEGNLRREAEKRGVDPSRLIFAPRRAAARASRAPPARRPVSRHLALQRPHDGQRRVVGGIAGPDLQRRHLRRPCRGQPIERNRRAGTGDGLLEGI